jgi:hypothetical protein
VLLACCAGSLLANSQEEIEKMTEPAQKVAEELGVVVLPIPRADPTLGTGLLLTALAVYNVRGGSRPWLSGIGALYTDNDSAAIGVFQKAYLMDERLRLTGMAGAFDLNLKFFGVGADAGARGVSIPIEQEGGAIVLKGLYEVGPKIYLGPVLRYISMHTTVKGLAAPELGLTIPEFELQFVTSGLGAAVEYDTRDSELNPRRGAFASLQAVFPNEAFGSDTNYRFANVEYNHYLPLAPDKVLALRASACGVDGKAPFFDLCNFGSMGDLRGYVGGQYRDRAMFATQGELRWQFLERWGAVAFAGVGSVAPSFGELDESKSLPSYGVGLRFLASRAHKVNVSVDVARGRDDTALYFRIGEAF